MRSTVVVVMIAMLVGTVPRVSAQTLSEGARVRVTTPEGRLQGTLASTGTEAFTLALENGGLLTIRRDSVEHLDVSAGRKGNEKKGFLVGAAIYVVVGATYDECLLDYEAPLETGSKCRAQNAAILGLSGGLLGALIGHFLKSDRWVRVDSGPQITLTLPKRGIGAQVSVGW